MGLAWLGVVFCGSLAGVWARRGRGLADAGASRVSTPAFSHRPKPVAPPAIGPFSNPGVHRETQPRRLHSPLACARAPPRRAPRARAARRRPAPPPARPPPARRRRRHRPAPPAAVAAPRSRPARAGSRGGARMKVLALVRCGGAGGGIPGAAAAAAARRRLLHTRRRLTLPASMHPARQRRQGLVLQHAVLREARARGVAARARARARAGAAAPAPAPGWRAGGEPRRATELERRATGRRPAPQVVALANLLPPDADVDELDSYMYQVRGGGGGGGGWWGAEAAVTAAGGRAGAAPRPRRRFPCRDATALPRPLSAPRPRAARRPWATSWWRPTRRARGCRCTAAASWAAPRARCGGGGGAAVASRWPGGGRQPHRRPRAPQVQPCTPRATLPLASLPARAPPCRASPTAPPRAMRWRTCSCCWPRSRCARGAPLCASSLAPPTNA
jgi:hypothetical protein